MDDLTFYQTSILFDFLEICGMFLERILDVFGYDFASSPLRIV